MEGNLLLMDGGQSQRWEEDKRLRMADRPRKHNKLNTDLQSRPHHELISPQTYLHDLIPPSPKLQLLFEATATLHVIPLPRTSIHPHLERSQ
jgi:hypothetical protein